MPKTSELKAGDVLATWQRKIDDRSVYPATAPDEAYLLHGGVTPRMVDYVDYGVPGNRDRPAVMFTDGHYALVAAASTTWRTA